MPLELNLDWAEDAACAGTPRDWWFPVDYKGAALDNLVPAEAQAHCDTCPVRAACHRHALHHELYGVWAGTSERQRRRLRKAAGIRLDSDGRVADPVAVARTVDLHRRGTPPPRIAEDLGVNVRTVFRYLDAAGITNCPADNWRRTIDRPNRWNSTTEETTS